MIAQPKVACYGIAGSHTEAVILDFFKNEKVQVLYFTALADVAECVATGVADYGVMPTENSQAGAVHGSLEAVTSRNLKIIDSFWVDIIHSLILPKGAKIEQIDTVLSHYQGLLQCKNYLKNLNPNFNLVKFDDTASSAKHIATKKLKNTACVAHARCADVYGLDIYQTAIQDCKSNRTHFMVFCQ